MNLHCRVTSYIENSNYFENIIFSFFYYEAEGITLSTTWKSRMSLRKKLWLIADRVSYQKSWQVKVNTLVRLKSDQVEQMTHTLYFITPRRYADVSRWNINCFLFVNCPFTWFTKTVQLNFERIGSWVLKLGLWFIAAKKNWKKKYSDIWKGYARFRSRYLNEINLSPQAHN